MSTLPQPYRFTVTDEAYAALCVGDDIEDGLTLQDVELDALDCADEEHGQPVPFTNELITGEIVQLSVTYDASADHYTVSLA